MLENYISKLSGLSVVGGEGKRLRPHTDHKPKALLPVGKEKKPMLEFTITPWVNFGIKNYVFCIGYRGEMIKDYFKNGEEFGVRVDYSVEKSGLETGGAIKNALDNKKLSKDRPLVIFYCDDIVKLNVGNFIKSHLNGVKNGFKATIVATKKFRTHYGILEVEDVGKNIKKVIEFKEKPLIDKGANAGIYCIEPEVLGLINKFKPPFKFERIILPELVKRGWLVVHEIPWDNWLPINTEKEYSKVLNMDLKSFYSKV